MIEVIKTQHKGCTDLECDVCKVLQYLEDIEVELEGMRGLRKILLSMFIPTDRPRTFDITFNGETKYFIETGPPVEDDQ